uniref:ciliary microtubule-associated protein 3 n=1 Tax=Panthera onca TaxID=9690 RepID=UPI002953A6BA|nr:ciliary microtubule-associated protein 3 [Panthera onca]
MCFSKADSLDNYSFGTCQQRKLFPQYYPPNLLGNKFIPLRGAPHRGPGCYIAEDMYGLAYNLSRIPTSRKGYTFGARTAVRFKSINKDMMLYPGMYQTAHPREQKHKQNFAPFNTFLPRFRTDSKDTYYPGPGTYNPEMKPPKKITWPMKFGSPDWAQVPCLQKRTLRTEVIGLDFCGTLFLMYQGFLSRSGNRFSCVARGRLRPRCLLLGVRPPHQSSDRAPKPTPPSTSSEGKADGINGDPKDPPRFPECANANTVCKRGYHGYKIDSYHKQTLPYFYANTQKDLGMAVLLRVHLGMGKECSSIYWGHAKLTLSDRDLVNWLAIGSGNFGA